MTTAMNEGLTPITLERFKEQDCDRLYDWINEADLQGFSSPFKHVSRDEHRKWFDRCRSETSDSITLGIYIEETGLIGYCSLSELDRLNQSACLQIKICNIHYRNKGIGTRCISMLCSHAYNDLNLRRIEIRVFSFNERAISVYRRCGFKSEGTLRKAYFINGAFEDVMVMSRLRGER